MADQMQHSEQGPANTRVEAVCIWPCQTGLHAVNAVLALASEQTSNLRSASQPPSGKPPECGQAKIDPLSRQAKEAEA